MFNFDITKHKAMLTNISLVASLISLPLGIYQWVASWYITAVINVLNIVIYVQDSDYAQAITRVYTLLMTCYGIYQWSFVRGTFRRKKVKKITQMTSRAWWLLSIGIVLGSLCLFSINRAIESSIAGGTIKGRDLHFARSGFLGSCILAAQWMTAHKKLESNLFWFCVNVFAAFYHKEDLNSIFWVKYIVYLPCCLYGYKVWYSKFKKEQTSL